MMSDVERRSYEHYIDTLVRDTDVLQTQLLEARIEGHKKGRAEGRAEERLALARKLKLRGMPVREIAELTDLTEEELSGLLNDEKLPKAWRVQNYCLTLQTLL